MSLKSWTHSSCDYCWEQTHPEQKPYRLTGAVLEAMLPDTCCYCGKSTKSGIYFREDPEKIHVAGQIKTVTDDGYIINKWGLEVRKYGWFGRILHALGLRR